MFQRARERRAGLKQLRICAKKEEIGFTPEVDEDRELVAQICSGHPELFHELVHRHEAAIFRGAMAVLANTADAEDVTQETFLRAFRRIHQFRGEAKFRTWLIQIAVNIARSKLKKTRREHWSPLETLGEIASKACAISASRNPEEEYSRKEDIGGHASFVPFGAFFARGRGTLDGYDGGSPGLDS